MDNDAQYYRGIVTGIGYSATFCVIIGGIVIGFFWGKSVSNKIDFN
jgi:hypothetical protein